MEQRGSVAVENVWGKIVPSDITPTSILKVPDSNPVWGPAALGPGESFIHPKSHCSLLHGFSG
jgi:hypothetical protein